MEMRPDASGRSKRTPEKGNFYSLVLLWIETLAKLALQTKFIAKRGTVTFMGQGKFFSAE